MSDAGLLTKTVESKGSMEKKVSYVRGKKLIKDSQLMDILEFGRMIHAEMSAISDAARLGRETKATILFSTTFPCHICAKHIVSAGIGRVVFLEPYPKSYAESCTATRSRLIVWKRGRKFYSSHSSGFRRGVTRIFSRRKTKTKRRFGESAPLV
jgi:deoxycytidylate deaminase